MSVSRIFGHSIKEEVEEFAHGHFARKLVDAIENHINDPYFGLVQLADLTGVDYKGLTKLCRELTGDTPAKYLLKKRLQYSERLLSTSAEPIQNIACDSGFMSYSGFWKAFTKSYGCTPQHYRSVNNKNLKSEILEWNMSLLAEKSDEFTKLIRQEPFMAEVLRQMLEHLSIPGMTLEILSDHLKVSSVLLTKYTKQYLKIPPMKLVQQLRLLLAAELLSDESNAIASIAYQVGFFDQAHFTKAFKTLFDVTPGVFRKTRITIKGISWLEEILPSEM